MYCSIYAWSIPGSRTKNIDIFYSDPNQVWDKIWRRLAVVISAVNSSAKFQILAEIQSMEVFTCLNRGNYSYETVVDLQATKFSYPSKKEIGRTANMRAPYSRLHPIIQ